MIISLPCYVSAVHFTGRSRHYEHLLMHRRKLKTTPSPWTAQVASSVPLSTDKSGLALPSYPSAPSRRTHRKGLPDCRFALIDDAIGRSSEGNCISKSESIPHQDAYLISPNSLASSAFLLLFHNPTAVFCFALVSFAHIFTPV